MNDLDAIMDDAAAQHPQPSTIAPELVAEARAELGDDAQAGAQPAGPPGWNPAVHESPPQRTTRGTWKLKRGKTRADEQAQPATPAQLVSNAEAARAMADTFFALAGATLGPDWQPSDDERSNICAALTRYYEVNGAIDLPPGAALALAVGAYALPRALMPSTRARISSAVAHVRSMLGGGAAQTPADDAQPAAQTGGLARAA